MKNKPKIFKVIIVLLILVIAVFIVRFVMGGDEDSWICVDNQWVKHGNPSAPQPLDGCGQKGS